MFSYIVSSFLLADQKHFTINLNIIVFYVYFWMFYHFHKIIQKVYLLLKNLDQLKDLNIGFAHIFLGLIDIYSNTFFFQNLILIVVIVLNYSAIPHINAETNLPPPIINVVCKYLIQVLGISSGVATLPICCNSGKGCDLFLHSEPF